MRLALLALLLAASAVRAEEPPIGTLVDIGGRKFHLVCMGSGSPTVVFKMEEWRAKRQLAGAELPGRAAGGPPPQAHREIAVPQLVGSAIR